MEGWGAREGIAQVSFHDDTVSIRPIGNLCWHLQGQRAAGRRAWCICTSDTEAAEGRGFRPFVWGKATNARKKPRVAHFAFPKLNLT